MASIAATESAQLTAFAVVEQQLASGIRVHGLLLALSTSVTIVACCFTAWQVFQHGTNYTKPNQQRQLVSPHTQRRESPSS
jgi:hypothetical protein